MAKIPRTVKIKKGGVEFTSNIDKTKYLISELIRAANLDVGKLIRRRMLEKLRKDRRGMRRSKRLARAFQFWARKMENDLVIGIKHNTWYGVEQELGTRNQPKRDVLKSTVMENIDDIRRIQGQYISAIEEENKATGLIRPNDEGDNNEND
ncbi:hypothetical protein [Sutcliffiella cohnii]|uniref:hypothetical protein n=1 Tax=Sutcliffiella cohnii TaxID=33932 RepID=UPI002E243A5C|nr:hypothetical protein [Sutcliffiella cohnii]